LERRGQLVTEAGQAVTVTILAVQIVEIVNPEPSFPLLSIPVLSPVDPETHGVWVAPAASVMGQTVVEIAIVSVVTKVGFDRAGQSVTED
jgi:hypothetical protein